MGLEYLPNTLLVGGFVVKLLIWYYSRSLGGLLPSQLWVLANMSICGSQFTHPSPVGSMGTKMSNCLWWELEKYLQVWHLNLKTELWIPMVLSHRPLWTKPCTAIPYRARTGPEPGFPCVVILTGKNLFSSQGTPLLIAGFLYSLQGIPCENYYTGKSL